MEQTAVEFLIEELGEYFPTGIGGIELMVKKANEMFEKQIEKAWKDGWFEKSDTPKEYYHKTFKIE